MSFSLSPTLSAKVFGASRSASGGGGVVGRRGSAGYGQAGQEQGEADSVSLGRGSQQLAGSWAGRPGLQAAVALLQLDHPRPMPRPTPPHPTHPRHPRRGGSRCRPPPPAAPRCPLLSQSPPPWPLRTSAGPHVQRRQDQRQRRLGTLAQADPSPSGSCPVLCSSRWERSGGGDDEEPPLTKVKHQARKQSPTHTEAHPPNHSQR